MKLWPNGIGFFSKQLHTGLEWCMNCQRVWLERFQTLCSCIQLSKSLLEQPGTIRSNAHSLNSLDQTAVKWGGSSWLLIWIILLAGVRHTGPTMVAESVPPSGWQGTRSSRQPKWCWRWWPQLPADRMAQQSHILLVSSQAAVLITGYEKSGQSLYCISKWTTKACHLSQIKIGL